MKGSSAGRLTPRKQAVLAAIIESYVLQGEPVGSKLLGEQMGVSSATIRNDMASLSELGYIEQPHTSAGRIPSQSGYRRYVDTLMKEIIISPDRQMEIDRALLLDAYEPEILLDNAAKILSAISGAVALTTSPSGSEAVIRGVQFVQTGRRTAMAILMVSSGAMKNKVFRCDFDLTAEMTRIFFRVLNEQFAGRSLKQITPAFVQNMALSMGNELAALMISPIMAVTDMAREALDAEIRLNGQMNLLFCREFGSAEVREILSFLESRREMCRLLFEEEGHIQNGRVRILIGRESNRPELRDTSIVLAPYYVNGENAGVLGVVGPTRMDYRLIAAYLDYISESVGRTLTQMTLEG